MPASQSPARPGKRLSELLDRLGLLPKPARPAIAYVPVRRRPRPRPAMHRAPRRTNGCA